MIYLDNSATTRPADEVTEAMLTVMREDFGNPSSLHPLGLTAQNHVSNARRQVAKALAVREEDIIFNSGGTEGDNTVLEGVAQSRRHEGKKIITTQVEHPAILEACHRLEQKGFDLCYLPVDEKCRLNLDTLRQAIDEDTILVSMMAVNNECGSIFPIREAAELAHAKNALFHTDAVQGLGKVSLAGIDADFITMSGHKIHGPKGVGALYAKKGVNLPAYIVGGGQEKNRRSGTENVPGIVGFGKAVELLDQKDSMGQIRQYLLEGIQDQIKDIRINSPKSLEECAGSVLNVSFMGCRGEVLLHTLEQHEIYVSTGSACSSNKKGQSHVLTAMGLKPKEIEGAIRFSFSRYNTMEEMDVVLDRVKSAVTMFRRLGSFR